MARLMLKDEQGRVIRDRLIHIDSQGGLDELC